MTKKINKKRRKADKYSLIVVPDNRSKVWRWEISRKRVEAVLAGAVMLAFTLTGSILGFAHYKSAYVATEDIRLENAKFLQERHELLSKLAGLETIVEKTQRFANRIEYTLGMNSDGMQKGIGPVMETNLEKPASVAKFEDLKYENEDGSKVAFSDINTTLTNVKGKASEVDERLQMVYELNQDRLSYWASLPSMWPAKGWVTSGFGRRSRPIRGGTSFHQGLDIAATPGTPILAPGDGIVTYSGYKRGLGNCVMVDHGYGIVTVYGHNSTNYVKKGDRIKRGEIIGSVGRTGLATGAHLHYQIEVDGVPVDPMKYIKVM